MNFEDEEKMQIMNPNILVNKPIVPDNYLLNVGSKEIK